MQRKIFIVFLLFLGSLLFSEPLKVGEVTYNIEGNSREYFLENFLKLRVAEPFETEEDLEIYLKDKKQDLINLRLYDSVEIFHRINSDHTVDIDVNLDDTWNLIPIAVPLYNSNEGFKVSYKIYYSNVLGTLMNSKIEGKYNWYPGDNITDSLFNINEPRNWYSTFTLSDIRIGSTTWSVSTGIDYSTEESANENNPDELDIKFSYYSVDAAIGTSFDLPGRFSWGPSISITRNFNYDIEKDVNDSVKGNNSLDFGFDHSLNYNKVNWMGNFKEGYSFALGNAYAISSDADDVDINLTTSARYYKPWKFLGYSTSFETFYTFGHPKYSVGDKVRGVADNRMTGNQGLFLQNNLAIKLIEPRGWELQAIPFIDMGIAWEDDKTIEKNDFKMGAGTEFVIYPGFTKSFLFRLSGGISLLDSTIDPEIDMTASLSF
ncbi:ShlB/FhaC/HecB family hemolysin secretion/activation protein [Spirochaeta cellobiosiphila]|uniref:ShlB/FhaC/HecB family hemolysin secretion/activation protein n=1 Tax=Spirochaeta cellobiosiphila TaxID=504483 RepID=UPI000412BD74|nr:ShlB/FhaC/HecB family hemolysin secretion/activation protein [Spirochaeta cellobiosiphila]